MGTMSLCARTGSQKRRPSGTLLESAGSFGAGRSIGWQPACEGGGSNSLAPEHSGQRSEMRFLALFKDSLAYSTYKEFPCAMGSCSAPLSPHHSATSTEFPQILLRRIKMSKASCFA